MLESHILTEEEKKLICSWKYEDEYSIYNMPEYEVMKEKQSGLCNPKYIDNFKAYYDGTSMVGFTNAFEEDKEVCIGIGVNPQCCNNGYGQKMLSILSKECKHKYPDISGEEYPLETGLGMGMFYRMVK